MKNQLRRKSIHYLNLAFYILISAAFFCTQSCADGANVTLQSEQGSTDDLSEFPDTQEGQQLKAHVFTMTAYGINAEQNYQASLTELRKDSTMHETVFSVYKQVPEHKYVLRTLLVETLKELRTGDALNYLNEIATTKIPEERSIDPEYSTSANEVVIRVTAVEGLSFLAKNQDSTARRLLLGLSENLDKTIQQMAIRGYLASISSSQELEGQMEFFRKKLPQEDHWMITNQGTDIKTVPHPEISKEFNLDTTNTKKDTPKLNN